jgi:carboxyl-terminal processing protease
MSFGTQVKVTISRYYTPSGRCIQALDYTRKDKNGVATRTEEKNYNAFKTRKGRTVYDGGGIQPDIELAETQVSAVANAVLRNEAIFDYATTYYYKNPNLGITTETELNLKKTLAAAKKEKIDESITAEYQQLLNAIQKSEWNALDKNQKEIKNLLLDEIIKRYQYQEGLYQYYIKSNPEIKKAVSVLSTSAEYISILKL